MSERQARILVVEDEALVAQDIRLRLETLGYTVLGPVTTGAEALRMAAADSPALVLMDVVLSGGMDGVETAAQLRAFDIPLVYLTAYSDDTLLERAKITEPFGYLIKPYTERELHATVVLALYRHQVKQQLAAAHAQLARAQVDLERKVAERTAHLADLNQQLMRQAADRAHIEQALRESERHLRQIIDLVPHRIFVKDYDGRFILANRAVAEAYGMEVDAVIGRHQTELHRNVEEVSRMLVDDRMVINSGTAKINYEESFTDIDGSQHVLRTTKIPYRIPDQERPAVLGMAMDITEEKLNEHRLVASEQKYRALLENAVDAILLADTQGNLIDANRRAESLLGYTREELCGMHALQLHPPQEHARVHEVFRELARSGNTLVQHPVLRKDGTCLQIEVAATRVHCGEQSIVQGIFRDVTERERRSRERLEQEQRHRDTLVREVHHRIKNNLQGVVGLLREHANVHPEIADVISSAIGQVQSISVVHGLHGQGDDQQVRLCDMVQAIARNASMLTRAAVQHDVRLAIEQPVRIHNDEAVPIALILNELILNAVKHGAAGSGARAVKVHLSQLGALAEVSVRNPGSLPAGFDFRHGKGSGTGLGLVRALLPHTGAQLQLEQSPEGVCARLILGAPVVSA